MHRFLIITNKDKDPEEIFTREVCRFLAQNGAGYQVGNPAGFQPDCILVLGGDGTVLRAAGEYQNLGVPFLGINLGTLGYLAEIEKSNWKEALEQLMSGAYTVEDRMMLEGRFVGRDSTGERPGISSGEDNPDAQVHTALNDIVIGRVGALRINNYDVSVNGQFLNTYNADGIIVSTPTGSTAYNLSAGGPIIEPESEMIVLTPICPHQMGIRSIVLSAKDVIEVRIGRTSREKTLEAEADFDGSSRVRLGTGDRMIIRQSALTTKLVKLENRSFLETLHRKMS